MTHVRLKVALMGALFAALVVVPILLSAQEYVVFKVNTHFDDGRAVPDSGRANDYFVKIGSEEGIQIGTIMNNLLAADNFDSAAELESGPRAILRRCPVHL